MIYNDFMLNLPSPLSSTSMQAHKLAFLPFKLNFMILMKFCKNQNKLRKLFRKLPTPRKFSNSKINSLFCKHWKKIRNIFN